MGNLVTDDVVKQKIAALKSIIPQDVIGLEYNSANVTYTYDNLISACERGLTDGASANTLFIGESMGAYLAAQLAAKYKAWAHLTVPVVNVYDDVFVKVMKNKTSWSFGGGTVAMTEAQAREFGAKQQDPRTVLGANRIAVAVASNDTLLGSADATSYYSGKCTTFFVSRIIGHGSISDVNAWKCSQQILYTALAANVE